MRQVSGYCQGGHRARGWIEDNSPAFHEFTINARQVKPPLEESRQITMAGGEHLDDLHAVEMRERFLITQHTRGHRPSQVMSY